MATFEAHDSACAAAPVWVKAALRPAQLHARGPERQPAQEGCREVAEWTPALNACGSVARTLEVRRKYGLTIDGGEAAASEAVLKDCESTEMEIVVRSRVGHVLGALGGRASRGESTPWPCGMTTATAVSPAPRRAVTASHRCVIAIPYRYMRDGDGDGVVCE